MPEQETAEPAAVPFDELYELVEEYRKASEPGIHAAFLRHAWEDGKDISKFGDPATPEEIADLKHDDALALAALADRLDLSLRTAEDLLEVVSYAHTARQQHAWERDQFPDKPGRWSEHYEIWAWEPQRRQSLANGVTTLARLTGETYMLTSRGSRFKVTPETTMDDVMGWYNIPTPEQSLEAEGYIDPRHFAHHYSGFRQAERRLVEKEYGLDHRVSQLTRAFREFGTTDWYNYDIGERLRVAVSEGGQTLGPFTTDRSERNDWRAYWAVVVFAPDVTTVFRDVETGKLGVVRSTEDGETAEIPEDQETVVAALEAHLTAVMHPGSQVRGWPIDVYQIYTVHPAGSKAHPKE